MSDEQSNKRKEIYKHEAENTVFAAGWSVHPDKAKKYRLAVASFIEEYSNKKGLHADMFATTGDYLRLWRVSDDNSAKVECTLNNNKSNQYCAPLTSCDWNEVDLSVIAVSSIDTTITIWQIETGQAIGSVPVDGSVKTQLIAHDNEVCDVEFTRISNGRDVFASVGTDGSVRVFDMRHLEHSTIMYEEPKGNALLRLACNKQDPNYIALVAKASSEVSLLDIRVPNYAVAKLRNHAATVNGVSWAPHTPYHICTAGDDSQALIWDLHCVVRQVDDPILAYQANGEINQVLWSTVSPEWIAICYDKCLEILKV